jgi:type I restriction enzyme, S subunit
MSRPLPTGWSRRPLGEIAETALGKMLDRGRKRGLAEVPYLRNVNVQWNRIDTWDLLTMELADDERERFGIRAGDLLVCEGGEIGRAAIWSGGDHFLAYQKALHRVRPSTQVESRFLLHLFAHWAQNGTLKSRATGSTILHLPQQHLRQLPVPLPPVEDQRHIVDILEDHLSRLDAADTYLVAAIDREAGLTESVVSNLVGLRTANRVPLASVLAEPLRHGRSVPTADVGFPVLRLTSIRDGRIDCAQRKIGAWSAVDARPFLSHKDDFLVARGNGSRSLVGRGGLVVDQTDPVAYPDTTIRVRSDPRVLDAQFLAIVWDLREVRRQIERAARTTAGIYKVNQADLRGVAIPVPTLSAQRDVVTAAGEIAEARRRVSRQLQLAMARSASLRRSLLHAAFIGRLTGSSTDCDIIEELANV